MDLAGTEGADSLVGGVRGDRIWGFGGDDTLAGGNGDDSLWGGNGSDWLSGDKGDDVLFASPGSDHLTGGAGRDQVSFEAASGVHVSLAIAEHWQDLGDSRVWLSGVEDLRGSLYDDDLYGDDGDNWIDGFGGSDLLAGGGGNDVFTGYGQQVTMRGGAGSDTFLYAPRSYDPTTISLLVKDAQALPIGTVKLAQVENISTGEEADQLVGDRHDNILAGGLGLDILSGGNGDDRLYGDGQIDTRGVVTAQADLDDSFPFLQADVLAGGSGNDILDGGWGADTLRGGSGADTLVGGDGLDLMTGGEGADTFVFRSLAESGAVAETGSADLIGDLTVGDHIDISAIDAKTTTTGDDAFHLVSTFTHHAGEAVLTYDPATDVTHLLLDANGDGGQDMIIDMAGDHRGFAGFVW